MELTIEQTLQQGVAAHREGKLEQAERLYKAILQSQPMHPDANHNLGVIAVSVNKIELALPLFKTALEVNPKKEQFWLSYIDALIKENQLETAKVVLEKGRKLRLVGDKIDTLEAQLKPLTQSTPPELSENKKSLTLKEKRKKISESKQHKQSKVKNADGISPSQSQINNLLEHYQNERYGDAEKSARSLSKQFPCHNFSWKILGAVLKKTGRASEAVFAGGKTIEITPDDAEAYNNLGNTLQELGRLDEAEANYKRAIVLKPDYAQPQYNLGNTLQELGRLNEAEESYRRAIALKADDAKAHNNFGITLHKLGKLKEAEASYRQAIELKPDFAEVYSNLGATLKKLGRLDETEASYAQAIVLKPDYAEAYSNLGNTLQELGRLDEAEASYRRAIGLNPYLADAHNNLGSVLQELDRLDEAKSSHKQAIALKPDFAEAFWSLSGCEKTIKGAEHWINKCLLIDTNDVKAKLIKAALRFYQGDRKDFDNLMQSELKQHSYMRSFSWVFSLPNLPELHFDKFYFFDAIVKKSIISKPFYEFGVWRASSFKYLIKVFKKGYGFDTFTGLPEDWHVGDHIEKKGSYSSDGNVPKIKGGEFIVGKFEDTLPLFFSKSRPMASVINFDADLYSSTICALSFSKSVIDNDTILIFDEFIMHESWEHDEFKALNEFCFTNHCSYKVVAISFFTKQVAVKLIDF